MFKASMCVGLGLALWTAAAMAQAPGELRFVEGQAAIDGGELTQQAVGRVVGAGQMLATGTGRASVELQPGVLLRLDSASAVKMVAVGNKSEVLLEKGRAEVEIAPYSGRHDVQLDTANGTQTVLLERGEYGFDANAGQVRVYEGKASVSEAEDTKWVEVKGGHELALNGSAVRTVEFDDRSRGEEFAGGYGEGGSGFAGPGYPDYGYPGFGYDGFGPGYGFYPYGYGFYPGFYGVGIYGGGFYGRGFYGGGFRGRR